jgi:DNA primase
MRRQAAAALRLATDLYAHALWEHPPAQRYLASRGVPEELAVRFRLGYAAGKGLVEALHTYRVPLSVAFALGLLGGSPTAPRERFTGRLIVPELRHDRPVWLTGRWIAFDDGAECADRARALRRPKYLSLAGDRVLGGAMTVANQPWAVVTEGCFDWLALVRWGLPACYVGGQVGGQAVPRELVSALATAQRIYLALDPDAAGRDLLDRIWRLLPDRAWVVELPDGCDPGDFGRMPDGEARFRAALAAARPLPPRSGPSSARQPLSLPYRDAHARSAPLTA